MQSVTQAVEVLWPKKLCWFGDFDDVYYLQYY